MDVKVRKGTCVVSLQAAEKRLLSRARELCKMAGEMTSDDLKEEFQNASDHLGMLCRRFPVKVLDGQKDLPFAPDAEETAKEGREK